MGAHRTEPNNTLPAITASGELELNADDHLFSSPLLSSLAPVSTYEPLPSLSLQATTTATLIVTSIHPLLDIIQAFAPTSLPIAPVFACRQESSSDTDLDIYSTPGPTWWILQLTPPS